MHGEKVSDDVLETNCRNYKTIFVHQSLFLLFILSQNAINKKKLG